MSAADRGEIGAILDAQYDDYQAMLALGVQQENSFSRNDLSDLDDNFQQLRLCMNRIRLRETQLPTRWQDDADPTIAGRCVGLRRIIGELDRIRQVNEQSVRDQMQQTRLDLKQSQSGKKAVRNYLSHSGSIQGPRFYDGRR